VICIYDVIDTEEGGITALLYKPAYAQITRLCVSVEVLEFGEEGAWRYPSGY
jgi:hypothetical protein